MMTMNNINKIFNREFMFLPGCFTIMVDILALSSSFLIFADFVFSNVTSSYDVTSVIQRLQRRHSYHRRRHYHI